MSDTNSYSTQWITSKPIAHRGLHDASLGIYENTLSAAGRAIEHGYGIEVDLHPSKDRVPFVFHDNWLGRMTGKEGRFRDLNADELNKISIGGTADRIPRLAELLQLVDGKTGLVLELKGIEGQDKGFVAGVLKALEGYRGSVAIMSFDHWLLDDARTLGTGIPVGLTAEGDDGQFEIHHEIDQRIRADFVSYGINDLPNKFVKRFRQTGRPVITWTIRDEKDVKKSALYADQITFEGFFPSPVSKSAI